MTLSQTRVDYEQDFNLWIEQTVMLLRARRFAELDIENLVDELESMSRRDKREILNRLDVLLMYLLKWTYQSQMRSGSWESSIQNNRKEIERIIDDSPSLRNYPATVMEKAYESARKDAARETKLPIAIFPLSCPFAIDEILDEAFWPDAH
jgi:hypothetical protein